MKNQELIKETERFIRLIDLMNSCNYDPTCSSSRYNFSGIDWVQFVRYSSVGGIYFCAPDEPGNSFHISKDDELFSVLKKLLDLKIDFFNYVNCISIHYPVIKNI